MFKRCVTAAALVTLVAWTAAAQDAKTVISNASKAMGADNLKTLEYSGSGMDFALGQNYNPNSPWPKFINKTYTRQLNFETPASQVNRIRMQGENPPHGGGNQPVRGEQPQNQTIIIGPNTPWAQQLEIWMFPYGFLKAAVAKNGTSKPMTVDGKKYNLVTFTGDNKALVNGYINDQNMLEKVETWIDNTMLGDMQFEALYSDYKDFGGVKFPTHIVQRQGGFPILDLTITDVKPNAMVDIKPAQGGGPGGGGGGGGQPAGPLTEKLADGVFLITGGYAALAVDFKDYIVVIEGPQSEQRAQQVIDEAKKAIPNKPIRYVVNTHHHFDHAGGLRTFVAEGATIITHDVNKPFLEKVMTTPHTLNPDKLQAAKKAATFETMTEKKVLTDGNHVIELHHMQNFGHHEGMIIAYLPKEKILLEADGYNAAPAPNAPTPNPISPYNQALVDNMKRLKLDVELFIPVHYPPDNRKVLMPEVMRTVGQGTN